MDVFSDNAKVKLVYIQDATTSRQKVIYEGNIMGFRNNLSSIRFNGFDNGQHIQLVETNARILNKFEVLNNDSKITNVIYYAGPENINVSDDVF